MSELLTISEVSARLRVPVATLRFWRHQGTGPKSFRIGGKVVYKASDVEGWVQAAYDADAAPVPA